MLLTKLLICHIVIFQICSLTQHRITILIYTRYVSPQSVIFEQHYLVRKIPPFHLVWLLQAYQRVAHDPLWSSKLTDCHCRCSVIWSQWSRNFRQLRVFRHAGEFEHRLGSVNAKYVLKPKYLMKYVANVEWFYQPCPSIFSCSSGKHYVYSAQHNEPTSRSKINWH